MSPNIKGFSENRLLWKNLSVIFLLKFSINGIPASSCRATVEWRQWRFKIIFNCLFCSSILSSLMNKSMQRESVFIRFYNVLLYIVDVFLQFNTFRKKYCLLLNTSISLPDHTLDWVLHEDVFIGWFNGSVLFPDAIVIFHWNLKKLPQ